MRNFFKKLHDFLFPDPVDVYLSYSTDVVDFERRLKNVQYGRWQNPMITALMFSRS